MVVVQEGTGRSRVALAMLCKHPCRRPRSWQLLSALRLLSCSNCIYCDAACASSADGFKELRGVR